MAKRKTRAANGCGSVYQRKDRKGYFADVPIGINPTTGRVKTKTLHASTQSEVVRLKKDLESKLTMGTYRPSMGYTVGSWLDEWLAFKKPLIGYKSYEMYELFIRLHIKPTLGLIKLEKLETGHIQKLLQNKLYPTDGTKPLAFRSGIAIKQTLHIALKKAAAQHLISSNPADNVEMRRSGLKPIIHKAFTLPEMLMFLSETTNNPYHYVWQIAFLSGIRRSELLALRWDDIDFEKGTIRIDEQVTCLNGLTFVLKTLLSTATIPVLPTVIDILKQYKHERRVEFLKYGISIDDNDLIFSKQDKSLISPGIVSKSFRKERLRLQLRSELTFHSTRHTYCTLGLQFGMEVPKMMALMRHSDISTTMMYASKMEDDSYRAELAKMQAGLTLGIEKFLTQK